MGETRAGKYGRNLAVLVKFVIEDFDLDYRKLLVAELKRYSFEGRKKGERRNSGCVYELEGIDLIDINNPEQLARLVKEGLHLMYLKPSAKRAFDTLVGSLEGKV